MTLGKESKLLLLGHSLQLQEERFSTPEEGQEMLLGPKH